MGMRVIYLVGFMGAGKTTVGTALARALGWSFVDLDREIEAQDGREIREIFAADGEKFFRRLEAGALLRASRAEHAVVALGGGAYCSEANCAIIGATGVSVWLDTPLETILERCPQDGTRPLLAQPGRMKELLEQRLPDYARADLSIRTAGCESEEIARGIIAALRERGLLPGEDYVREP